MRTSRFILILALFAGVFFARPEVFAQADKSLNNSTKAATGSEWLEKSLASPRIYNIPAGQSTLDWLVKFAENLELDLVQNPEKSDRIHLMLGDAYHWIGHIWEDRGLHQNAWVAYEKSYENYNKSPIEHSIFISNLKTRDHGKMHLVHTGQILKKPLSREIRSFAEKSVITNREIDDCLALYRDEIKTAQERINTASPKQCSKILSKNTFVK